MSEHDHEEPIEDLLARARAQLDQAAASMDNVATLLAALRDALIQRGFTVDQAFALCTVLFSSWVASMLAAGGEAGTE